MERLEQLIKSLEQLRDELEKSAFKDLQHKIEGEGHSAESAAKITAAIGRKKLGEAEMEHRSEEARKSEVLKTDTNGQWSIEKSIEPFDPGVKPKKYQGGDPKHALKGYFTRRGQERERPIEPKEDGGKMRSLTTGTKKKPNSDSDIL